MKHLYLLRPIILVLTLLIGKNSYAQQVTGTFSDINGKELQRLTIWHTGGTIMGANGKFEFDLVKPSDTVQFFIEGYTIIKRKINRGENLHLKFTPLINEIQE